MTAYQQLRAAYLMSGRTIAEIAAHAGYAENTVARVLGPRPRNVRADVMLAVAGALGQPSLPVERQTPTSCVVTRR